MKVINRKFIVILLSLMFFSFNTLQGREKKTQKLDAQILSTMKKATHFMMDSASYRGGFVWEYLPDLSRQ